MNASQGGGRSTRRVGAAMLCLAVGALLAGCGARPAPALTVLPARVATDQPVHVAVTGLDPGATVVLRMTSAPASGAAWSSSATFRADVDGTVSTTRAPIRGDYSGARADGLEEALHAPRGDAAPFEVPTSTPWRLQVAASVDGRVVARASVVRRTCLSSVTLHRLAPARDHVLGILYEPLHPLTRRSPGVVAIGGSGGGLGLAGTACDLAADGIPALAVAYFHAPGLPDQLQRIPLEYFGTAARLLADAPGVDPRRVVLLGESRGSEAAVLTAARYPTVIHGVVLTVPAAVAGPAPASPNEPAWTFRGRAVPTAGLGTAVSDPAVAALPIERVDGPVLTVCAGEDAVWPSCPQSAQLRARLHDRGPASRFTLLTYPAAGHFVGSLTPFAPSTALGTAADGDTTASGGTALADAEARDDAWPRLVSWLRHLEA